MVGFDRNQNPGLAQPLDDRQQLALLRRLIHTRRVPQRGFRPHVNDRRPLRRQDLAAANRARVREADAFAIPRIRRQVDHAHDRGLRIEGKVPAGNGEFFDEGGCSGMMFPLQFSELFESEHGRSPSLSLAVSALGFKL